MAGKRRSPNAPSSLASGVTRGVKISISTGTVELRDEPDGGVTVYVNDVPSSSLHPDPLRLDFEYMRHEAAAIAAWSSARGDDEWLALHVGAAACTFPRHLLALHPSSRHIAVDLDADLAEMARRWWDLPRSPRLRIRAQDGLAALAERGDGTLDLIVRDAFWGSEVPDELRGPQWWQHARRVLRPGGLVVANTAVTPHSDAAAADAREAHDAFGELIAIGEHAVLKRKRRGNAILVTATLPLAEVTEPLKRYAASAPLPTGVVSDWR